MIKKILLTVATIACVAMVGCGNSEPPVVNLLPGMSIVADGNGGTLSIDPGDVDPYDDLVIKAGDKLAPKYGVQLESNQGIISEKEGVAIVVTALDGYKFANQLVENSILIRNTDYTESYTIYACTDTLTVDYMKKYFEVKDLGNGCYLETDGVVRAYWFKDDVSVTIVYANNTQNATNIEKVTADIMAITDAFKICK